MFIEPGTINFSEMGYSEEYKYLLIRFKEDQSLYAYLDVPQEVVEALNNAESPGKFFNDIIRNDYEYIQLE